MCVEMELSLLLPCSELLGIQDSQATFSDLH